ncbi:phosphate ABC transporter permease subunit PstC [candidate division NPL-UPA2 bacterium Unc8]|uniref:Phosphate transport system permease protein n=1 Tax=candidate division NPL-UPA2 bacterium Unc8 TaxID=1980939 RepID=A0A399FUE2_UNCN2|nr:Phosphate transport system permease protein PstC [Bacillota bacterium]RIH99703.1 MAG: phosphate ABC transporter permease subunit PstC [candidate division NPL-UPA2 bacterium Unc8]
MLKEWIIEKSLIVAAMVSFVIIAFIIMIVFRAGVPLIAEVGVGNFLFGMDWRPEREIFGIFPMIIGTLLVALFSMLISVPLGILTAIFLAEVAPEIMRNILRPAIELLAGIPSVVYGFVGLMVLVPFIRTHLGPPGFSILAGSIVLAIMALPTIITISEDAIKAVPKSYKEASFAVGATHWQTIKNIILPAARSGILAGVVLGSGRAIGETMAAIMVLGNLPVIPTSVLGPIRTLTANVAMEMAYAPHGPHRQALFATGVVLFIVVSILVVISNRLRRGQ